MSITYFIWFFTVQTEQHLKISVEQANQNQLTSLITGQISNCRVSNLLGLETSL